MTRTYTYLLTYLLTLHGANHTVPSTPGPLTGAYTYLLTYLLTLQGVAFDAAGDLFITDPRMGLLHKVIISVTFLVLTDLLLSTTPPSGFLFPT